MTRREAAELVKWLHSNRGEIPGWISDEGAEALSLAVALLGREADAEGAEPLVLHSHGAIGANPYGPPELPASAWILDAEDRFYRSNKATSATEAEARLLLARRLRATAQGLESK